MPVSEIIRDFRAVRKRGRRIGSRADRRLPRWVDAWAGQPLRFVTANAELADCGVDAALGVRGGTFRGHVRWPDGVRID
jgi:hypothetical protein